MGSMSIWHWLLLLGTGLVIYVIVKLLTKVSFLETWLTKILGARFAIESKRFESQGERRRHRKLWWLPLPFALLAVIAVYSAVFLTVFVFVGLKGSLPAPVASTIDALVTGCAIVFIFVGLVIHYSGGIRSTKYEFLVAGVSLLSIPFFFLIAQGTTLMVRPVWTGVWGRDPRPDVDPGIALWTVAGYVMFLVAARIGPALLVGPPDKVGEPSPPSPRLRRLFGSIRRSGFAFGILAFSGLTQPLLTLYLIVRYIVGERMSDAPILYLRSFHYAEGPTAFGKIVARVASRYGELLALVHETQGPLELHAQTRLTERAEFTRAPDAGWRDWVTSQMRSASAIIIDRSVSSEGLSWELDQALSHLDPSRIILLTRQGVEADTPSHIWNLQYEIGEMGERRARKKLDEHLRAVFLAG